MPEEIWVEMEALAHRPQAHTMRIIITFYTYDYVYIPVSALTRIFHATAGMFDQHP